MYLTIPAIVSIENHEGVSKLSKQFKAIPVFAGIRLRCIFTEKNVIPVYLAGYVPEFTGFKAF